jgi:predicted nucleic acid-binding protein
MNILDTNVVSELMRPEPSETVERWVSIQPAESLYITSITQAEILHGILLLPKGKRRLLLEQAADGMFAEDFGERILPFGAESARLYAQIAAGRRRAGRPISHFDAQIAAIARLHGATLSTRNVDDFTDCGVTLVNPWSSPRD